MPVNVSKKLGDHFVCDLSHCDTALLYDSDRAYELFASAVRESGLTIVSEGFYRFAPHGFTCFLLLAESHASLHAWPEHGYCAIDLFTCTLDMDIRPLVARLRETFGAQSAVVRTVDRFAIIDVPQPVAA